MTEFAGPATFEVGDYLEQRSHNPSFVMVEIGYGPSPLIGQQPHDFSGQQAYIGIEAGMRGQKLVEDKAKELRAKHAGQNAFFLLYSVGEGYMRTNHGASDEWWEGDFEPRTILPAGAADELVASNVFCDPLIAKDFDKTTKLLNEVSRLTAKTGMVVLRETITPWKVEYVADWTLEKAGLEVATMVTPLETKQWAELEKIYGTQQDWPDHEPYDSSYYLFLAPR